MAKIFITGSADGLGQLAAQSLIAQGHDVVLHARNEARAQQAMKTNPKAAAVLTGDLSNMEETKALAHKANEWGTFDTVIHNAGVYRVSASEIFAVNTIAPYLLTAMLHPPERLIYLSSGMHLQGTPKLEKFTTDINRINYSDSKLHVLLLCKAVARLWTDVFANAVDPGWVPTKMGGRGAPDDLQKGYATQVWLATSNDAQAKVTGRYFFHQHERRYNAEAGNEQTQDQFLAACAQVTGVFFPRGN